MRRKYKWQKFYLQLLNYKNLLIFAVDSAAATQDLA